jgi:fatty acid synthase subunit beta
LIGKYIPNVTARPFELTKEYFEDVYRLTNSPRIGHILANWEKYQDDVPNGVNGDHDNEHANGVNGVNGAEEQTA